MIPISQIEIAAGCYGKDGYGEGIPDHAPLAGLNAVVLKSTSLYPMSGNEGETFFTLPGGFNYWNRVGLKNPGIANVPLPPLPNLRLSLYSPSERDWITLIREANDLPVQSFEFNLSCPNAFIPERIDVQRLIDIAAKPVFVKIRAGQLPDPMDDVAGLICGNSIPCVGGGLSGAVARYFNLALTRQMAWGYSVTGCGGIRSESDAEEYFRAGATKIQIGSSFKVSYSVLGQHPWDC